MARLEVRDLTPAFGVEIGGYDPNAPLDDAMRGELRELFDRRGLLVFRDLDLTHDQQVALATMLIRKAAVTAEGEMPIKDTYYISNRRPSSAAPFGRLQFHADGMWSDKPFEVLSLYGMEVEQPTAPTTFVSGVAAWRTLPDALRARAEGREALHTAGAVRRGDLTNVLESNVANPPSTVAKIDRCHPRTGETILFACEQMTKEIVGMPREESEDLLGALFAHLYRPESRFDHEWRKHDLIVWDNLALQHSRKNVAIEGPARTLRKVASPLPPLPVDQRPVYGKAEAA